MDLKYIKCFFCKFEAVKKLKDTERIDDFIFNKPEYMRVVNDDYFESKCELCGFIN